MTNDQDQLAASRPARTDIGWRQFSIGLFDLIRWPIVVIVIILILRIPLEKLLDAIAVAVRN